MNKKNINLKENNIDDNAIIKALSSLKEVSPPEGLLKDAIADARRLNGRPVFKERPRAKRIISFKYLSAAAALVLCIGLGFVIAVSSGTINNNTVKDPVTQSAEKTGINIANEQNGDKNSSLDNAGSSDLMATASPNDNPDVASDSSTQELTSHALYENHDDLIDALSEVFTCGIKTDELSDDIIIYANDADDVKDILKSYIYDLIDSEGKVISIDELSGIITVKVEFE